MKYFLLFFLLIKPLSVLPAPIAVDDSIKYISYRLPYLAPGLSKNTIVIKLLNQQWSEVCVTSAEECFILSKQSGKIISYFDQYALELKRAFVIFQKTTIDNDSIVLKRIDNDNFGVLIDDLFILSEVLRNIQSYSKSTIPTLLLTDKKTAKSTNTIPWFQGYLPNIQQFWVPAPEVGALISIGSFSQRSPEVFDASIASFLKNSKLIESVPSNFVKGGILTLMPWNLIVGTIIDTKNNRVIADRIKNVSLPRGPLILKIRE